MDFSVVVIDWLRDWIVGGKVTLHNQALMNMDIDPTAGFRKLNFLLQVYLL